MAAQREDVPGRTARASLVSTASLLGLVGAHRLLRQPGVQGQQTS